MNSAAANRQDWLAALGLLLVAAAAVAEDVEFVRVNVPVGGMREMPLDDQRYLPMPLVAFEEAVARITPAGLTSRLAIASEAGYELALDANGGLSGTLEFKLAAGGPIPASMPLGDVIASRCRIRTTQGTGEAVVFCMPQGGVAIRSPGPATYTCEIQLPATAALFRRLPLVPALVTRVDLMLPADVRPIVVGGAAATTVVEPPQKPGGPWRIVCGPVGPAGVLPLMLWDGRRSSPPVASWNTIAIRGRQADVASRIEPMGDWTPARFELVAAPRLRITQVRSAEDGRDISFVAADGVISIEPPSRLVGSRGGVLVNGIMPIEPSQPMTVPVIKPGIGGWGGCFARLVVDPALTLQRIEHESCLAVPPSEGNRWPLPPASSMPVATSIEPPRLFLEYQSPEGKALVTIGPREASFDTARITTVDISPGTVLGRTAVDLRVVAGQVFRITADVAPGWFIDSVEAVDWGLGREGLVDTPSVSDRAIEWRVVRSRQGSELRIGLADAATPRRGLGLRITGHRSGLPLGGEFSSDDMDMVRFPGEMALLEFQVGPTAVLEAAEDVLGLEPVSERFSPLVGLVSPRARILAGQRSPAVRARLVRKRPPVEADIEVSLVAREDRLAESFTFTCRPVSGELDAVVVHFSEPLGPGLEWAAADPQTVSLAAQLLAEGDATQGELRGETAVAESWLVELRPATTAAVTFRATRSVALEVAVPVPLAWVEAAQVPGGRVTIRGEAGQRPEVFNRSLQELPPAADADANAVELAYGPPQSLGDGKRVADVMPPPVTAASRAWAWRQTTTSWCYESGGLDWETVLDIENQGRELTTISLPVGLQAERVTVGDETFSAAASGPEGRSLIVPLPRASGRIRLVLRGSGNRDSRLGGWRISDLRCGIDMPVLDRETWLMLPPGLVVAFPVTAAADRDWQCSPLQSDIEPIVSTASKSRGFRGIRIPDGVAGSDAAVVVLRRRLVVSLAIAAGCLAAGGILWLARRNGPVGVAACGAAAVAAVWSPEPWDTVARAILWGGLAGLWAAGAWQGRWSKAATMAAMLCLAVAGSTPAVAAEPPLRVYVTPGDNGGTALVPEPLFRRLSAPANSEMPAVRVLATRITADGASGTWRVQLDLDADRGGVMELDQEATGATWRATADAAEGLAISLGEEGRRPRIMATSAGRHRLTLDVTPVLRRSGDLEAATILLPPAPEATLEVVEADDTTGKSSAWQCDRSSRDGPWIPAPMTAAGFDIATAGRVRLVRAVDRRVTLMGRVRAAVSFNDIAWGNDEYRLTASFDVGVEGAIVRSLLLRADPVLEPVDTGGGGAVPRLIGEGRFLVEIPEPRSGQRRVVVEFRRSLSDPVGTFDAPFAWLETVETDIRTVRLRPTAELDAVAELPPGMALIRPRIEDGVGTTAVWRSEAIASTADAAGLAELRPMIAVRRSPRLPRITQDLAVEFADTHIGLRLRGQIEATDEPLLEIPIDVPPAAVIDSIEVAREPSAGEVGQLQRVDLFWSRTSADRIVAVIQQAEAGRFRLQLNARLPIRPARRGRLPVARVAADETPLAVSWQAAPGMTLSVSPPGSLESVGRDRADLAAGDVGPAYTLSRELTAVRDKEESSEDAKAATLSKAEGAPLTTIDLGIDANGRCWGLARFDLLVGQPVVTLSLPAGLRLFDVRVDGREATASPLGGNAWNVRLHDVTWPRSLVVVFAGTLGDRLVDGAAIQLEPPRLVGLPAGEVLWTLETPAGLAIRASGPASLLDPDAFAARRKADRSLIDEAFIEAVRRAPGGQRDRLDAFASALRAGSGPAGERSWYTAWRGSAEADAVQTQIAVEPGESVSIRGVRVESASVAGRRGLTLVILGIVVLWWIAARRLPAALPLVAGTIHRWWWMGCGLVWLVLCAPPLPGVVMLVAGAWLALPRAGRDEPPESGEAGFSSDPTMTFVTD